MAFVNGIVRRSREKPARDVACRFLKLFSDHGVKNIQIQRLIPEVTLDKVSDPGALLPALTNDVLDRTANLFGIERDWLDGCDSRMYPFHAAYQNPHAFFQQVAALSQPRGCHPLRAYCADPMLDRTSLTRQVLVLVFAEQILDEDAGIDIVRFRPLTEEWLWDYRKSRLQLKALLRTVYDHCDIRVVPLYVVDDKTLHELAKGRVVPPDISPSRDASLEDYILAQEESCVAKEADELNEVRACMASMGIREPAMNVGRRAGNHEHEILNSSAGKEEQTGA